MQQLRPAIVLIVLFTLLTGVAFPLVFVGIGQIALPFQAGGSLIRQDGQVIGSALIGQDFSSPRYFHPRLSATREPDPKDASKTVSAPYAADNSGASNLGPTSKGLVERVTADVRAFGAGPVPADAVTTSASGLDPDISPENAALQVPRVAMARNLPAATIRALVAAHTKGRIAGFIGEPRVNVLALNLAIDAHR
jgi:K+-transporting ATPase ATPase C chain